MWSKIKQSFILAYAANPHDSLTIQYLGRSGFHKGFVWYCGACYVSRDKSHPIFPCIFLCTHSLLPLRHSQVGPQQFRCSTSTVGLSLAASSGPRSRGRERRLAKAPQRLRAHIGLFTGPVWPRFSGNKYRADSGIGVPRSYYCATKPIDRRREEREGEEREEAERGLARTVGAA